MAGGIFSPVHSVQFKSLALTKALRKNMRLVHWLYANVFKIYYEVTCCIAVHHCSSGAVQQCSSAGNRERIKSKKQLGFYLRRLQTVQKLKLQFRYMKENKGMPAWVCLKEFNLRWWPTRRRTSWPGSRSSSRSSPPAWRCRRCRTCQIWLG